MIPVHTDRPDLARVPIVRIAALIRVLGIEPALDATHGLFTISLACMPRFAVHCERELLLQTHPKLTRKPRDGTECGWASTTPHIARHSSSRQQCRLVHLR